MRTNWPHANWRIEQTPGMKWPIQVYLQGFDGDMFVPTQVVDIANMGMTAGDAARMSWTSPEPTPVLGRFNNLDWNEL